ncbi:unnamed protein product [Ixodes pacificus]
MVLIAGHKKIMPPRANYYGLKWQIDRLEASGYPKMKAVAEKCINEL